MERNIKIIAESFESELQEFKAKEEKIEETLNMIKNLMQEIDGENETWKGKTALKVSESYHRTEERFDDINAKLKSFETYLNQTLKSYKEEEQKQEKSIEENMNNLYING